MSTAAVQSTKSQGPNPKQSSNTKIQNRTVRVHIWVIGVWNLGFSDLAIVGNNSKMVVMPAVATRSLIQREIGDDRVCLLTFDRPESGANIFDAATMSELGAHVAVIERAEPLRGLIDNSPRDWVSISR